MSNTPQPFDGAQESTRRRRVTQACDQCRGRKEKCDGNRPKCSKCSATRQKCSYGSTPKRRGLPTGYVRALEMLLGLVFSNIDRSEETLRSLLADTFDGPSSTVTAGAIEGLLRAWRKSSVATDLERFLPLIEGVEAVPNTQRSFDGEGLGQQDTQSSILGDLSFLPTRRVSPFKVIPVAEATYADPTALSLMSLSTVSHVSPQISPPNANTNSSISPRPAIGTFLEPMRESHNEFYGAVGLSRTVLVTRTCPSVQHYLGRSSGMSTNDALKFWSKSCISPGFSRPGYTGYEEIKLPANSDRLIDIYFSRTHSWLPFIAKHDILRLSYSYANRTLTLRDCQQDSERHAVLWAVMAFATLQEPSAAEKTCGVAGMEKSLAAEECYEIARSLIPFEESDSGIGHVQALLVLALYNLGQGIWNASWLLVGHAVRLALSIGADKLQLSSDRTINLDDHRKRVFLGCFVLDTLVSARLGRLPHLRRANISAVGSLEEDGLEEWDPWSDPLGFKSDSHSAAVYKGPVRILSIFNQLIGICGILNDLLCHQNESNHMSEEDYRSQYAMLRRWVETLPAHCRLPVDGDKELRPSVVLPQLSVLHLVFSTSVMVLQLNSHDSYLISPRERESVSKEASSTASDIIRQLQRYADAYGFSAMPPIFEYFASLASAGQLLGDNQSEGESNREKLLPLFSGLARAWHVAAWTQQNPMSNVDGLSQPPALEKTNLGATLHSRESPLSVSNNSSTASGSLKSPNNITPMQSIHPLNAVNDPRERTLPDLTDVGPAILSLETPTGGSTFERQALESEDVDMRLDDLAFLEGLESTGYHPQFLQNLGYAPDAASTGFLSLYYPEEFQFNTSMSIDVQNDPTGIRTFGDDPVQKSALVMPGSDHLIPEGVIMDELMN